MERPDAGDLTTPDAVRVKKMGQNVLLVQRRMPKYRLRLFDKMRESLEKNELVLELVHGTPDRKEILRRDEGILPWATRIRCMYFRLGNTQLVYQPIPSYLLKNKDLIIVPHENRLLFNYLLLIRHHYGGPRIAFFGHGANFQAKESHSYREKIKQLTARKADWWFAYTSLSVARVIESGFPEQRITCVNNTVEVSQLIEFQKSITPDELYALRQALGLMGNNVGIFIGSLYGDKRPSFLFSAANELRRRLRDFELIMIGDGPLRDKVHMFAATRPWVRWVGEKHGREKVLHISLGKVMLNPGLVGLGILDSFALGIPMITTDCGIHSPEIAYLESGRNGIMTPDNLDAYVSAAENLFINDQLRKQMSSACAEDAKRYSLDKMVDNFCEGIFKALDVKPLHKQ